MPNEYEKYSMFHTLTTGSLRYMYEKACRTRLYQLTLLTVFKLDYRNSGTNSILADEPQLMGRSTMPPLPKSYFYPPPFMPQYLTLLSLILVSCKPLFIFDSLYKLN